jgi:hypothetical protein
MARYKYMQLKILDMLDDVIEHYKLRNIVTPDGHIYCEIQKEMYGLPQMAWLGNPFRILRNPAINPIPDLLNSGICIGILFFRS